MHLEQKMEYRTLFSEKYYIMSMCFRRQYIERPTLKPYDLHQLCDSQSRLKVARRGNIIKDMSPFAMLKISFGRRYNIWN